MKDGARRHRLELRLTDEEYELKFNVSKKIGKSAAEIARKGAIKAKIPYYTTIAAAKAAAEGIAYVKAHQDQNEEVNSLQGLHAQISDKF